MSWITTKLLGIRQLYSAASPLPQRPSINFLTGATVVDNPATNATDVTINESTVFVSATNLATPNTIAKRSIAGSSNFGGTCHFVDIQSSGDVSSSTATIASDASVGGDLSVHGSIGCTGSMVVGGGASIYGSMDSLSFTTASITCTGNTSTTGTLTAGGTTVSTLTCTSGASVGALTCSGAASVGSSLTVTTTLGVTGAASVGSLTSGADVTCAPGSSFKLGSTRTYTRATGSMPIMDPTTWTFTTGVSLRSVGTGSRLHVPLTQLPPGAILTSVSVWVSSVGVHTLLPLVKRQVSLVYITSATGAETATWTTSDPSGTVALYDAYHAIVATGSTVTFNQNIVAAYIQLIDESSTNSIAANTKYYVADFTYTMDRVVGS